METQWQCAAMGGFTGLMYASLPVVLDALNVAAEDRGEILHSLRWLEKAALSAMYAKD